LKAVDFTKRDCAMICCRRSKIFLSVIFAIITLCYCEALAGGPATAPDLHYEQQVNVEDIQHFIHLPLVRQARDYTCGVSALRSLLLYYGEEYGELELAKLIGASPRRGTSYRSIIRFANQKFMDPLKRNFQMRIKTNMTLDDLRQLIDQGKPTIVLLQAWGNPGVDWKAEWNEGHYAVVVGYDENNIYFMDPSVLGHYAFVPIEEFLDRWHDKDPVTGEKLIRSGLVIGNDNKIPAYQPGRIKRMN
jgi:predicted double-glycine peptidase